MPRPHPPALPAPVRGGLASNCRHLGFLAWGLSLVSGPLCFLGGRLEAQENPAPQGAAHSRG